MESQEKAPRSRSKPLRLLPFSSPLKCRDKVEEPKKRKTSKSSGIGPMCIFIKEHKESMCRRLEKLYRKQENGLLDLDIECEGKTLHAHKVIMAAASKFFCSVLCKSGVKTLISIKLEDFGLCLTYVAVQHLLEFVYDGKVTIPGENLIEVCAAAHALGIHGLVDFLPASSTVTCVIPYDDVDLLSSSDSDSGDECEKDDGERITSSNSSSKIVSQKSSNREETQILSVISQMKTHQNFERSNTRIAETDGTQILERDVPDDEPAVGSLQSFAASQVDVAHQTSNFGPASQSNMLLQPSNPPSSTVTLVPQFSTVESISGSSQYQFLIDPMSPGQQSRGRVRLINQRGILTNTSQNIHTSTNSELMPIGAKSFGTSCKTYSNDEFEIEDQFLPNTFDHEQPCTSQLQNNQSGYLPVLQPLTFPPWSNMNNIDLPTNPVAFHLSETAPPPNLQVTEPLNVNETSWSNVTDSNWALQEDGDSRNSFVSPDNFTQWMSDVEALSSNDIIEPPPFSQTSESTHQRVFFTPPQTSDVLTLEPMQMCRDLNELCTESTFSERASGTFEHCQAEIPSRSPECRPPSLLPGPQCKKKRPDLEVRKDLIEPSSVPISESENVFQVQDTSITDSSSVLSANFIPVPETEANNHTCNHCQISFKTFGQLKVHVKFAHESVRTHVCHVCREPGFKGKESLKLHLYKEHGIGEYFRCEECSFKTSIKTSYTKHLATHAENRLFCEVCSKTFKSKSGLKLHLKQHEGDGMIKCSFCTFKTAAVGTYRHHLAVKHKKTEDGEDISMEVSCDMCSFTCFADAQLRSHILRRHTSKENMPFQCSNCDYASVEKAALEKHIRFKHTNERPFVCQTCGFSTHTHSAMSRHLRGHSKTKPHSCDICGARYADRKRLRDHLLTHAGETPYSCEMCSFATKRKDYLQAHVRRIHAEVTDPSEMSDPDLLVDFMSMADSVMVDQKDSKVFSIAPESDISFGPPQGESLSLETTTSQDIGTKSHFTLTPISPLSTVSSLQ